MDDLRETFLKGTKETYLLKILTMKANFQCVFWFQIIDSVMAENYMYSK